MKNIVKTESIRAQIINNKHLAALLLKYTQNLSDSELLSLTITNDNIKSIGVFTKRTRKNNYDFVVEIDGKHYDTQVHSGADVMRRVIKEVGPKRVYEMNIPCENGVTNILSKRKKDIADKGPIKITNGWWMVSKIQNKAKLSIIRTIFDKYNVGKVVKS